MHYKSSSGSFSDSPWHPRTMKPFQGGWFCFSWHTFPRDLGQTLSAQHRKHFWVLTPPQVWVPAMLLRNSQQKSLQISPHTRAEPIPNSHRGQEYPALMFCCTEGSGSGVFWLHGFVFLEQNLQNSKFSGPHRSKEDGCRFPIPNHISLNLIPHILKFNSSLLFFPYLFPLQFCDIFCCSENPSWTSAWTFPRKFL